MADDPKPKRLAQIAQHTLQTHSQIAQQLSDQKPVQAGQQMQQPMTQIAQRIEQ